MTTSDTTPATKPKITDVISTIVEALTPFESNERKRIIAASLALLGESQLSADTPSGGHRDKSATDLIHGVAQIDSEFFTKFDHDKPSDNALLVAAFHYAKYGSAPFSTEEARKMAESDAGLTVPSRLDMTYETATRNGKNLFARAGRGQFKPTVHGEKYLRETYNVKKGTATKPEGAPKL